MTQEEKQLLLKDLCARLPYGVKFQGEDSNVYTLDAANYFALQIQDMVFKPYLRPMSSMTQEEKEEWRRIVDVTQNWLRIDSISNAVDFFNKHHLDYRGLIEKGLALEAPADIYK